MEREYPVDLKFYLVSSGEGVESTQDRNEKRSRPLVGKTE